MRYSIEPRERRYVKGYGFSCFARTLGTHGTKVAKNLNNKYGQKLTDSAKKIFNGYIKNFREKSNSKTAATTGYLVGNTIESKITSI